MSYNGLSRLLVVLSILGLALLVHVPAHVVSSLGRLVHQSSWIDAVHVTVPARLQGVVWLSPALLALAFALKNRGDRTAADRPGLKAIDLLIGIAIAAMATAIRMWPLINDPWIKPGFDEGVYLGGAWLLRSGALPYRDFVFGHLPAALIELWPAARLIRLWHDNTSAVQAARLLAAASDGTTAGLIYLTARRLVAWPGALLAAVVYAADTLAAGYSRQVLLEPLQAPWLAAGALLILVAMEGRRTTLVAGLCLAWAVSIKITGIVAPLAAATIFVVERRRQALVDLCVGLLLGGIVVCGWSVFASGSAIVRQAVLLQLLRSPATTIDRHAYVLGDRWTGFTAMAAFLGAAALGLQAWHRKLASGWIFITLWLALTLGMLASSAAFYGHYYVALVPALALLAGASQAVFERARGRAAPAFVAALLLASLLWGQARLWPDVDRSPALKQTVAVLLALPPGTSVLSFDPLPRLLAGRPFPRGTAGPFILDTFLGKTFLNSSLNRRWPDAATTLQLAVDTSDYVLDDGGNNVTLPTLTRSFVWQRLGPAKQTVLWSRVDQPSNTWKVGSDLELLKPAAARLEAASGLEWMVQPLHWRAVTTPPPDLTLALHIQDSGGTRIAQLDVPLNGGTSWKGGSITTLDYRIPLPPKLKAADYAISATVYSRRDGTVVPFAPGIGGPAAQMLDLPFIRIPGFPR